jgi:Ca2+-binding RTX toxin-like protein
MSILFGTDQGDELFLGGSGIGIAVGLEGDDTIVTPLNPQAPGSQAFGNKGSDSIRSRGVGDTSRGGQDDDDIVNESGQAFLFGDLGDDNLEGREGQSTLFGGADDDYVVGAGPNNLIFGDLLASFSLTSADTVAGNDSMFGLVGGDTHIGGGGDDYIKGGPKEASLLFGNAGKDSCFAGADEDSLYGGKDADYMSVGSDASVDGVLFVGGDGGDKLIAFKGDNHILAGDAEGTTLAGNDYLWVSSGEGHILFGNLGNDKLIYGGSGSASLYGGQGDDSCYAEGADGALLSGDKGSDYLYGSGVDNSTFEGGGGTWSDTIVLDGGKGNMLMGDNGSDASDDFIYVHGSGAADGDNTLAGGAGNDYLCSKGGAGSDANVLTGASGDDTYLFGAGDTITPDKDGKNVYFGFAGAASVKVTIGVNDVILPGASGQYTFEGGLPTVAFVGTGGVITGDGKDFISLDNAASETSTEGGNDTLTIGMLDGGTIDAGAGDDVLNFTGTDNAGDVNLGSGNDTLTLPAFQSGSITGEAGDDIFNLGDVGGGGVDGGAGKDSLSIGILGADSLTNILGGADDDTIRVADIGSGGGLISILGGAGNDIILGGTSLTSTGSLSAAVTLDGGEGDDFLRSRSYGGDSLSGGIGNDIISGGIGADIPAKLAVVTGTTALIALVGSAANPDFQKGDFFDGDTLTGGAGKDFFVVASKFETGFYFNTLNPAGPGLNAADAFKAFGSGVKTDEEWSALGFVAPVGDKVSSADGKAAEEGLYYSGIYGVDTITDFKSGEDKLAILPDARFGEMTPAATNVITISMGSLVGVLDPTLINANGLDFTKLKATDPLDPTNVLLNPADAAPGVVVYDSKSGGVYLADPNMDFVLMGVLQGDAGAPASLAKEDILFTSTNLNAGIVFF